MKILDTRVYRGPNLYALRKVIRLRKQDKAKVQEAQGENYFIRDGIVVIPNEAVVPDGTVI